MPAAEHIRHPIQGAHFGPTPRHNMLYREAKLGVRSLRYDNASLYGAKLLVQTREVAEGDRRPRVDVSLRHHPGRESLASTTQAHFGPAAAARRWLRVWCCRWMHTTRVAAPLSPACNARGGRRVQCAVSAQIPIACNQRLRGRTFAAMESECLSARGWLNDRVLGNSLSRHRISQSFVYLCA